MAKGLAPNIQKQIVEALVNKRGESGTVTIPATAYIALFTTMPTGVTNGYFSGQVEVSAGGYRRMSLKETGLGSGYYFTNDATASATSTSITNTNPIMFPLASASWGTVVGFGLFDEATAGHCFLAGELTTSQAVAADDVAVFSANNLTVTMSPATN